MAVMASVSECAQKNAQGAKRGLFPLFAPVIASLSAQLGVIPENFRCGSGVTRKFFRCGSGICVDTPDVHLIRCKFGVIPGALFLLEIPLKLT